MKLYLLQQHENDDYNTYDAMVVAAPDSETARLILPPYTNWGDGWSPWCSSPDHVMVRYLGEAEPGTKQGIILSSFRAG